MNPATADGFTITMGENVSPAAVSDLVKSALSPTDWAADQSGREMRVTFREPARIEIEAQTLRQAVETIRNRVDALGVAEPSIQPQGNDRIVIQLPGVDDPARVKDIIGTTGLLELKIVDLKGGPYSSPEAAAAAYGGTIPANLELVEGTSEDTEARTRTTVYYVLERAAAVTGRDLKNARVGADRFNQPAVEFFLNAQGAEKFGRVTGDNVGRQLAIVLDKRVQSAPNIKSQITRQRDHRGELHGRARRRPRPRPPVGRAPRAARHPRGADGRTVARPRLHQAGRPRLDRRDAPRLRRGGRLLPPRRA